MANTFIIDEITAADYLRIFEEELVGAATVYRALDKDFAGAPKNKGDTINIPVPANLPASYFTGTVVEQDITESSIPVVLNTIITNDVAITSKEMTLSVKDFNETVLRPLARGAVERLDKDVLASLVANATVEKTISATPVITDIVTWASELDLAKAPYDGRNLVMYPLHYNYLVSLKPFVESGLENITSPALRRAYLGEVFGLESFKSILMPYFSGTAGTNIATFKIEGTAGDDHVKITNATSGGTFVEGEKFVIENKIYEFTEGKTASSTTVDSIGIFPRLHKTLTATSVQLQIKQPYSVAFSKYALALATAPLDVPITGQGVIASANGLSVRLTFGYDQSTKKNKISADFLCGIKVIDNKQIVRIYKAS